MTTQRKRDPEAQVTMWFTVLCPFCENAILLCDGEYEDCPICGYSRDYEPTRLERKMARAQDDPRGERRRHE